MAARRLSKSDERLHEVLEGLYNRYHRPEFLPGDPLAFAHEFSRPEDQEVASLICAALAFGNVKAIQGALRQVFGVLGQRPADWLRDTPPEEVAGSLGGIYYRTLQQSDLELFLGLLGEALRRYTSLAALWQQSDDLETENTLIGLANFTETILALRVDPLVSRPRVLRRAGGKESPLAGAATTLLASPRRGSACKRMHLFLRWMARPADGIDLGLWNEFLDPARLLMPVDVHVLRQAQALGLTKRKSPDARTAQEITGRLRRISPDDPTRYDFALVRAGIDELAAARRRRNPRHDDPSRLEKP